MTNQEIFEKLVSKGVVNNSQITMLDIIFKSMDLARVKMKA